LDTEQERETQIVQSSATPVFNESALLSPPFEPPLSLLCLTTIRKYEFVAPSYRSAVKFTLVDAVSEKKVRLPPPCALSLA
jgi:hypothetical protein